MLQDDDFLQAALTRSQSLMPKQQGPVKSPVEKTLSQAMFKDENFLQDTFNGPLEPGNIDLTKRPVVQNPDGSISTVASISVNLDGMEVLIPTVSDDGRMMTEEEAIQAYLETGRHLGKFRTPSDATEYARQLHEGQASMYGDRK